MFDTTASSPNPDRAKRVGRAIVILWFLIGGIAHFIAIHLRPDVRWVQRVLAFLSLGRQSDVVTHSPPAGAKASPRLEAGFTVSEAAWVWFEALQRSAMAVTLLASWLVASKRDVFRARGFWVLLLSNVLWVAWGWHTGAWALVGLQAGLVAMNIRGASQNAE